MREHRKHIGENKNNTHDDREMRYISNEPNLGEVSDNVEASVVPFGHYVEEEGIRVVVQRFVVQKQFGQQTHILRVRLQK